MFENRAGDFDDVHGEAAGGALHRNVADGDLAGEFDTDLGFEVGGDGADDFVEQLGLAIGALRRISQEDIGDLSQQLAAFLAGALFGQIEQQSEIVGVTRHADIPCNRKRNYAGAVKIWLVGGRKFAV